MLLGHVDPFSGLAGDMLLGALVDAGAPLEDLRSALAGVGIEGWSLEAQRVQRAGLAAIHITVRTSEVQPHRTLADVLDVVRGAALPASDREQAERVFTLLGEAEAAVHGRDDAASSHLHEVGGLDAIVDVLGAIIGLRLLGVGHLTCGPLRTGSGTVRSSHGVLPVPPPAVLEIARRASIPLAEAHPLEPRNELTTPTGAAIVGALATFARHGMTPLAIGSGAGTRDFDGWANVTRFWLGEAPVPASQLSVRQLVQIDTNIDDMSPEHLPFLEERLRDAGALDVWRTPVQMKKARMGVQVTAIAEFDALAPVADAMLRDSTTLGVRVMPLTRYEAPRHSWTFESSLGPATVKIRSLAQSPVHLAPEFEVCASLARRHGLPISEVYRIVLREAEHALARSEE